MTVTNRSAYVRKNVSNLAPQVRKVIVDRALERDVTTSDVVGGILAEYFGLEYEEAGSELARHNRPGYEGSQLLFRLPQDIVVRVFMRARTEGLTQSSLIQKIVADHFDVEYQPVQLLGRRW